MSQITPGFATPICLNGRSLANSRSSIPDRLEQAVLAAREGYGVANLSIKQRAEIHRVPPGALSKALRNGGNGIDRGQRHKRPPPFNYETATHQERVLWAGEREAELLDLLTEAEACKAAEIADASAINGSTTTNISEAATNG